MADVKTTVDGMAKKDIIIEAPTPADPDPMPEITATAIKAIAKEMAQPWKYGSHLQRYSKRHSVNLVIVKEIYDAVQERITDEKAPAEIEEVP